MQYTVAPGIKLQTLQIRGGRADERLTSAVIRPEERDKMSENSPHYGQSFPIALDRFLGLFDGQEMESASTLTWEDNLKLVLTNLRTD
jgi:hypothetical protein